MINTAGDPQFEVDWHLDDKIVDTNGYAKAYDKVVNMQNRNWTTPYQVRETLLTRRIEKPCPHDHENSGPYGYKLPGYDTCVIRFT